MIDLSALAPAAWGEVGALAYGFAMAIQAFRSPASAPGAKGDALWNLAFGVFIGPVAAIIGVSAVLTAVPRIDPRAAEVTLGIIAVPGFARFARWAQNRLFSVLGDEK